MSIHCESPVRVWVPQCCECSNVQRSMAWPGGSPDTVELALHNVNSSDTFRDVPVTDVGEGRRLNSKYCWLNSNLWLSWMSLCPLSLIALRNSRGYFPNWARLLLVKVMTLLPVYRWRLSKLYHTSYISRNITYIYELFTKLYRANRINVISTLER